MLWLALLTFICGVCLTLSMRPILRKFSPVLRSSRRSFLPLKTLEAWHLTNEERRTIRSWLASEGSKIYFARLDLMLAQAQHYLMVAATYEQFLQRKGFLESVYQTRDLVAYLLEGEPREEGVAVSEENNFAEVLQAAMDGLHAGESETDAEEHWNAN